MATRRYINFGVTPEEYEAIKCQADKNGMTAGQYCRMKAITESNIADIKEVQDDIKGSVSKLPDRETMKKLVEYLMQNLPDAVYQHAQKQRSLR